MKYINKYICININEYKLPSKIDPSNYLREIQNIIFYFDKFILFFRGSVFGLFYDTWC